MFNFVENKKGKYVVLPKSQSAGHATYANDAMTTYKRCYGFDKRTSKKAENGSAKVYNLTPCPDNKF